MAENPITEALLPPRPGYVEAEINGERVYRKVVDDSYKQAFDALVNDLNVPETYSDVIEQAELANTLIKSQTSALGLVMPKQFADGIESAAGDYGEARKVVSDYNAAAGFLEIKRWEPGMTTQPGDLVYDLEQDNVYAYSGATAMTHSNPTFYPGAAGVYYWAIVPKYHEGVKVYPNVPGIIVYVKHGEKWWDTEREHVYSWNGVDNPNCVWPPMPGNEWTLIE